MTNLPFTFIVDASISLDGREIVLKDYRNIYYWKRNTNTSVVKTLSAKPLILPYKRELQGESICFTPDQEGYYTVSESIFFKRARLFFYKRKG
jgi:hypothetical protein